MKTLYLTDLDGTFLNSEGKISENSSHILSELTQQGLLFSVATARTYATVMEMFKGIPLNAPLVLMNGVTVFDPVHCKILKSHRISCRSAEKAIHIFRKYGVEPMIFFQRDRFLEIFFCEPVNEFQRDYIAKRDSYNSKKFVETATPIPGDNIEPVYIVSLDTYEKLKPIYDEIMTVPDINAMFYRDNYSGCFFLELINGSVSKATGAREIKRILDADRIVAFGDNLNDLPLFQAADECYAVANAHEALKKAATGVIGSNDSDAVANYLKNRFYKEKSNG